MKSTRNIRKILTTSIAAAIATLSTPQHSDAANGTWNSNTSGNWSGVPNNFWLGGTVAGGNTTVLGTGFTANFVFNITATTTVNQDIAGLIIGNLVFTDATSVVLKPESTQSITDGHIDVTAGTFSIEANTLVQGTRSMTFNTGGTLGLWTNVAGQFSRQLVFAGGAINELGSASPTSTVNSNVVLANTTGVAVNGAGTTLTLTGNVTQSGGIFGLNKTAPGTLVLAGNQSWTGPLNVADAGGNVRLGAAASLPTRNISLGDGTSFDASAVGGHSIGAGGTLTVRQSRRGQQRHRKLHRADWFDRERRPEFRGAHGDFCEQPDAPQHDVEHGPEFVRE